jgi:predicted Ser/Thr protein kinase
VEALTALVAGLLSGLRSLTATEVCPGGWAWAVSALGVGVGLLPTVGALVVAWWRRRIGSRYGPGRSLVLAGTGLLTAGLLPLLAFTATGEVFAEAAAGRAVPGLAGAGELDEAVCVVGPQAEYLGTGTVAEAFDPADPLRFGIALFTLGLLPLLSAAFVAAQARLALRRGPAWPSKFFWVPVLAPAFLGAGGPAGAAGHLWLGVAAGTFLGMFVLLTAPPPAREVVGRSLAPPAPTSRPAPARPDLRRPAAPADPPPAAPSWSQRLSDRLAERFAARPVEPVVVPEVRSGATTGTSAPPATGPRRSPGPPRTLVAGAAAAAPEQQPARFRLIRRLGSGGFGRVWLAHDARLGHTVALKAAHAPDTETEERIRREARALGAVHHPHCVRIHELVHAGSDPGLDELDGMVIVMEYVQGSSLGELVRARGVLDDVAAARVWASIADALDAAHRRGVLHRDVKPGNVVVDPGGLAHLIDFGIARRTGDATMTMAGFVVGTPDFLAPEVAAGGRATPSSDAWQLAATISYARTGHPPRGGHADALSGLRAAAAGAPLTHLPARSAHLTLLRAALDTDPTRRPPLGVVHRVLEDWLRRAGARPDVPVPAGLPTR